MNNIYYHLQKAAGRTFIIFSVLLAALTISSCDEHEAIDSNVYPGHIMLADGSVITPTDYDSSRHQPVAVFFAPKTEEHEALAVLLDESIPLAISDTSLVKIGTDLGTTGSETDYDGYENTVALQAKKSPLAQAAFNFHYLSMSDYVPSVSEMELLFLACRAINPVISYLGGDTIAVTGPACWYWTSTEVSKNKGYQAWACSMSDGSRREAPVYNTYHTRYIVEYNPLSVK